MSVAKLIADLRALRASGTQGKFQHISIAHAGWNENGVGSGNHSRHSDDVVICHESMKEHDAWLIAAAVNAITPVAQGGGGLLEHVEKLQGYVYADMNELVRRGDELTREREQTKILREQLANSQSSHSDTCGELQDLRNQVRLLIELGDRAQAEKGEAQAQVIRLQAEVDALKKQLASAPEAGLAWRDPATKEHKCGGCAGSGKVRGKFHTRTCDGCNGTGVRS